MSVGKIEIIAYGVVEWRIDDLSIERLRYGSPTFIVGDHSWIFWVHFQLPVNFQSDESRFIFLQSQGHKMPRQYPVECKFYLKKTNGSMKYLGKEIMKENCKKCGPFFMSPISPPIIIWCEIKRAITHSTQPLPIAETKPIKLISLDRVSEKFQGLFSKKETCDTTLKVQDKEYKAHRAVLIAQSPVFAAMFMHDTTERQTGIINIPDCDPDSFQAFLEYLYSFKLEEISSSSALHLYVTSDKYEVPELKAFCVEYLKKCLTVENICEIVVFADKNNEAELYSAVQGFFNKNLSEIIRTPEWESLMRMDYLLTNKLLKGKYQI